MSAPSLHLPGVIMDIYVKAPVRKRDTHQRGAVLVADIYLGGGDFLTYTAFVPEDEQ
jgi:hypothetical protein